MNPQLVGEGLQANKFLTQMQRRMLAMQVKKTENRFAQTDG
jgi:hypothetical protein